MMKMRATVGSSLVIGLLIVTSSLGSLPADAKPAIVDLHVRFGVVNSNDSKVPCHSDGLPYTVDGDLIGPASILTRSPSGVTIYLHGGMIADIWHLDAGSGFEYANYALTQARRGHASVVFDNLGFGQSDIPNGNDVCDGSWADIAHQIAEDLRTGDYRIEGAAPIVFRRVALAGISGGGRVAEITAYSFPGSIDALVITGWADQPDTNALADPVALWGPVGRWETACETGGTDKQGGGSDGGYSPLYGPDDIGVLFHNADPSVVAAASSEIELDSCGDARSIGTVLLVDQAFASTISVPVLLVFGDHDIFGPVSGEIQRRRFSVGSDDVSLAIIPDSGHLLMLQRTAPEFASVMRGWLGTRGF